MATYTNLSTLEVLTQDEFSALICDATYTCCNSSDNVWFTNNEARTEYEWQQFFIANDMCNPIATLTMTFTDFSQLPTGGISDVNDLSQWNAAFSSNYTSINVDSINFIVTLSGGSGVVLDGFASMPNLVSVVDTGSVIDVTNSAFKTSSINYANFSDALNIGANAFESCDLFANGSFAKALTVGDFAFAYNDSAESYYLPSCTNLGATTGYDSVWEFITGRNITLTIPSALMTCNAGAPDGDIINLDNNNTVTIITI